MYHGLSHDNMHKAETLYVKDERGHYVLATPAQILAAARHKADQLLDHGPLLQRPNLVKQFLVAKLAGMEHEVVGCIFLNNQLRLIQYQEMFNGTVNQSAIYPREIVKAALRLNASAIIMAHNHPSGVANPSDADIRITKSIRECLEMLDMRLIDHLIVAGSQAISLAEIGEL